MADTINKIVDPEVEKQITELYKNLGLLNTEMSKSVSISNQVATEAKKVADSQKTINEKSSEYATLLNKAADEQNKLTAAAKELQNQQKQLTTTEARLATLQTETAKSLDAKKKALKESTELMKLEAIMNDKNTGSIEKAVAQNKLLAIEKKKLNLTTKEGLDRLKEINEQQDKNNELLKSTGNQEQQRTAGIRQYKQQIGQLYQSMLAGELGAKGFATGLLTIGKAAIAFMLSPIGLIVGAIGGIVMAGKALISNSIEFGKAASSLSAITGATGKDLDFMKQKAKEYARESSLSATEILGAFEKIGSAAPQLLKNKEALTEVTKAAITLAASSGGMLSMEDSAKAVTAAMNQFNIPASEANRIINTLAAGSQAGSAEVGDLTASFKNVGAVASGAGLSLEQTVAAIETLGEKGLYAEEAGTKLRGVILRLQQAGIGYASGTFNLSDALKEANGNLEKQGTAMEKDAYFAKIFGAENITAGKIMLDNADKFEELTTAVTGTNTAYEMAAVQSDNLATSNKKFKNAWSSMLLSIEDGSGWLTKMWKGFLDGLTAAMNGISKFLDKFKTKDQLERKAAKQAEKEREAEAKANEEQAKADKERLDEEAKLTQETNRKKAESAKKAEDERKKLEEAKQKQIEEQANHEYDMQIMFINATSKSKEEAEIRIYEFKKETLLKTLALQEAELRAFNGNELDKIAIQEKINKTRYDLEKEGMEQRQKLNEVPVEKMGSLKKKEVGLNVSAIKAVGVAHQETAEEMEENEKKATERRKEIIANGSDAAIQIQGALFDFINAKYQGDLQALEQKNSAGLLSDKEYAKQKAEIELKQAKASRTKGIFDATIGIAQAVINALQVQPFFPVGLIMAATAGVTGALQIGSILSAPLPTIPSFAVGTENAPTFGRFGEAGRELMELQSGKLILANKETYFAGNQFKGAKIFTNKQTEEIINRSGHSGFSNSISDTRIVSELQSLKQEIKDKPVFIFDKERNIVGKTSNNHTERYLNRYKFN